ncbi:MAG: AAA family ATPase [Holophagales bacterium]|nr:AAA family ATPase [Holophagales bacterium]
MSRTPRLAAALVALTLVLLAAPARADRWYEHYARAEKALATRDWRTAVAELNGAIEAKGDSGSRERSYGMRVVAYFPYFKLGIAYYHLGELEAAEQAFQTEVQLGAIARSADDLAELTRYRELTNEARASTGQGEAERIATIVSQALKEAESLEREGKPAEALDALDRALAVAPEHTEAVARAARLRKDVDRRERERQDVAQAASLVSSARVALDGGRFAEAASLVRQALALRPGADPEGLLQRAEDGILSALGPARGSRGPAVGEALAAARTLADAGRTAEALDRLQPALALEPGNREAAALLERLLAARRVAELRDAVARAVAEADAEHTAGRHERALAAANRALALDAASQPARAAVRRAYGEIGRQLLGARPGGNLPPAIRFADQRENLPDGTRAQLVDEPEFRLAGVAFDRSTVKIVVGDGPGAAAPARTAGQEVGDFVLTEFSSTLWLSPGLTTFRVTATDSEGLSSSAEYTVLYERPWTRSPWFLSLLGALPLAGLGAVAASRTLRRRRRLRRKFNPYVAGAPVLDERLFFGREPLIDRVLQTIHNNSLLLYGERRIGKTSLLHHLKRRLEGLDDPDFAFHPVLVDLQGVTEERFFGALMIAILDEVGPLLPPGCVDPAASQAAGYSHHELVRDLRAVIDALARRTAKRVKLVLLIDEVDELNSYDPKVNQRLRSLFMRAFSESLVAVVSGVEIRKQWERAGSPWYNFFEEIEVAPIDRAAAEKLVRRPIDGVFRIEDSALQRLLDVTGCRPYRIQRACVALVGRLHLEGRGTITLADVEAIAGEGLE